MDFESGYDEVQHLKSFIKWRLSALKVSFGLNWMIQNCILYRQSIKQKRRKGITASFISSHSQTQPLHNPVKSKNIDRSWSKLIWRPFIYKTNLS